MISQRAGQEDAWRYQGGTRGDMKGGKELSLGQRWAVAGWVCFCVCGCFYVLVLATLTDTGWHLEENKGRTLSNTS